MPSLRFDGYHRVSARERTCEPRGYTVARNPFDLPPSDRLRRYRELSAEAEAFAAEMAKPEIRDACMRIAHHWTDLGSRLEKSMKLTGQIEASKTHSPNQPAKDLK